jgi:hypothetical protein
VNRTGTKYRIFLTFWALSALYLCIGSLVHFHQYKIYGKKLVAEVVISKREHETSVKDAGAGPCFQAGSPAVIAAGPVDILLPVARIDANGTCICPASTWCLANNGLRAPPLA